MSNLQPKQFAQSEADQAIADMQRQIEGARASFGPGSLANVGAHFAAPSGPQTKPGFYRKDAPAYTPGRTSVDYEYQVPNERYPSQRSELEMTVHHDKPSASYSYGAVEKHDDPTPQVARHIAKRSWVPEAEKDALRAHAEGTPKLFGSSYTPGKSEVFSMYGTKRGSAHAATMLGIAARDTAIEHGGRALAPPDDLSRHSSKLVQNLKGKGVVDADAPADITNDSEHLSSPEYTSTGEEHRIPDKEVQAGRSTVRSVLRSGRTRKPRETYTQERLF